MRTEPNIVFVFADDWGWGDLGCYGHPHAKTPNLDRLASQGTLFTQFYVCSGVCSPSRAAAVTGQFPARLSVHGHFASLEMNERRGMPNWLDNAVPNYMRLLQEAGYRVGHYGKWHLGSRRACVAPIQGAPDVFDYGIDEARINVGNGPQLAFGGDTGEELIPGNRHRSSREIIDESIAFIRRNKDKPFCINVWLNDTHATLDPNEEQLEPYRGFRPHGVNHAGALAVYYATVTNADRHIGRLMDELDGLGIAENTVLIFSADNGPEDIHVPNASHSAAGSPGPFRGRKRSLYEGGVRTPFILRWPRGGARPSSVDDTTPLSAVDLLPTFCSLAGLELPDSLALDGEDMSDVFRGAKRTRKTSLRWEWRFGVTGHPINKSPMLAIRRENWKLLMNPTRDRVELYDVTRDRMELDNVAGANPGVVGSLAEEVLGWQTGLPPGPVNAEAGSNAYFWPRESR